MGTIARPRPSVQVKVKCARCGDVNLITDRQQRRQRQEGRLHVCALCRVVKVRKPTPAYYNFWLDRFTMDEIRDMARAIWG